MTYFQNPLVIASTLAQAFCIYHVIKHRKPWWWILFIVVFPMFGCFWYFMREVRGSSGSTLIKRRMVNLNPGIEPVNKRMIANLERQLEISDTVDIRLKIADGHMELGHLDQAVSYYESCLRGYHKDDPVILFGLSKALFSAGNPSESLIHLEHLDKTGRTDYKNERILLRAQALAELGETVEADRWFEDASNRLPGEEARCQYALFLSQSGNQQKAKDLFTQILRNAEQGDRDYSARNQEWIAIAKRSLRD